MRFATDCTYANYIWQNFSFVRTYRTSIVIMALHINLHNETCLKTIKLMNLATKRSLKMT
jgi:hypothetical protein